MGEFTTGRQDILETISWNTILLNNLKLELFAYIIVWYLQFNCSYKSSPVSPMEKIETDRKISWFSRLQNKAGSYIMFPHFHKNYILVNGLLGNCFLGRSMFVFSLVNCQSILFHIRCYKLPLADIAPFWFSSIWSFWCVFPHFTFPERKTPFVLMNLWINVLPN